MSHKVLWIRTAWEVLQELPHRDQLAVLEKSRFLHRFPHTYPVRTKGRFRRHRWFLAGDWLVYYRVASGCVYIRGLWPAPIP